MKKLILSVLVVFSSLQAGAISLVQGWNLVGTPVNLPLSSLTLTTGESAWLYKNGSWTNYTSATAGTTIIPAGSGFWALKNAGKSVTFTDANTQYDNNMTAGWNLVTPNATGTVSSLYNSDISYVWGYKNSAWSLWMSSPVSNPYSSLALVSQTDGIWVKAKSVDTKIGSTPIYPVNGVFSAFSKTTNTTIDNLYNISVKLANTTSTTFNIGLRIAKSTGTTLDIVFYGASLTSSGALTQPTQVKILKSNSGGIGTSNIPTTLGLINGVVTIDTKAVFDYLISRGYITSDYSASAGQYTLELMSDNLVFANDKKTTSLTTLYSVDFPTNSSSVSGTINLY